MWVLNKISVCLRKKSSVWENRFGCKRQINIFRWNHIFLFPFFQFLPDAIKRKIGVSWPYSHHKQWNLSNERILQDLKELRLLSKNELLFLFKDGSVYKEKYLGLTKSYAVYSACKTSY